MTSTSLGHLERCLLGGIILRPELLSELGDLRADDFGAAPSRAVYRLLRRMYEDGDPIDLVTVPLAVAQTGRAHLFGGVAEVIQMADHVPASAELRHYAAQVREASARRSLALVAADLTADIERPVDDAATTAGRYAARLAELAATGARDTADQDGSLSALLEAIDTEARSGTPPGISTGLACLDGFGTMRPGQLWVIGGRPGMGKSALARCIADSVARQHTEGFPRHTVGIMSLEMTATELRRCMLADRASVPLGRLLHPRHLMATDWARMREAEAEAAGLSIRIDDRTSLTADAVRARALQWATQAPKDAPLGLLVVDYLTLLGGLGTTTSERVVGIGLAAQGLKNLAKDLGITVIAVAQLNRGVEGRVDKRPQLSDLRESGTIEQAANVVAMCYRPAYYERRTEHIEQDAEVLIVKNRSGKTGIAPAAFVGGYVRWSDR
jgi:replicative DNA helicase